MKKFQRNKKNKHLASVVMARLVETSRPALSIYTTFARVYNQTKQYLNSSIDHGRQLSFKRLSYKTHVKENSPTTAVTS